MTVKVLQLNQDGDPTGEPVKEFQFVEQAQAWSEQQRGEAIEWGEEGRFFSLEGMTLAEIDKLSETAEYPPVRYWIFGVDEDGYDRELESSDWELGNLDVPTRE
jgi:hypothetical protein